MLQGTVDVFILTAEGRRQVRADSSTWREYAAAVARVRNPA